MSHHQQLMKIIVAKLLLYDNEVLVIPGGPFNAIVLGAE
jgi:hypothetical protein